FRQAFFLLTAKLLLNNRLLFEIISTEMMHMIHHHKFYCFFGKQRFILMLEKYVMDRGKDKVLELIQVEILLIIEAFAEF
ncbi:hypothetical protein ACH5RR_029704, partial [Cinchona calisaya]